MAVCLCSRSSVRPCVYWSRRNGRLQDHAAAFHADGITVAVTDDPGEADAREVTRGDEAGQEIELAIGAASGGGIEHPLRLAHIG